MTKAKNCYKDKQNIEYKMANKYKIFVSLKYMSKNFCATKKYTLWCIFFY